MSGNGYGDGNGNGSGYGNGNGSGYNDGYNDGYGYNDVSLDRFEQGLLCPNPQDLRALVINRIIVLGSSSCPKNALHSVQA